MTKASAPMFESIAELAPSWRTVNLDTKQPFGRGYWPMNPSVHYDRAADRWRCIVRHANYTIPNGTVIAPKGSAQSKNVMLELDPADWTIKGQSIVEELDALTRIPTASMGYEDVRLFMLGGNLLGIACALQLNQRSPGTPEQVLLAFDRIDQHIVAALPLRGSWAFRAQKNWMPFDGADDAIADLRFLYDIDKGCTLGAEVASSALASALATSLGAFDAFAPRAITPSAIFAAAREIAPLLGSPSPGGDAKPRLPTVPQARSGIEVKMSTAQNPKQVARAQEIARPHSVGSAGLRGGTQLVKLDASRWIGIGHEMSVANGDGKLYWHTFFTCDGNGRVRQRSRPLKLAAEQIEFAAGLALTKDRSELVISFGTDDHEAHLGIVSVDEIEALLDDHGELRASVERNIRAPWTERVAMQSIAPPSQTEAERMLVERRAKTRALAGRTVFWRHESGAQYAAIATDPQSPDCTHLLVLGTYGIDLGNGAGMPIAVESAVLGDGHLNWTWELDP